MDFSEATDALMEAGVNLADIGEALGVAYTTVRTFRLDPASANYRRPPEDWRRQLVALARERSVELREIAKSIARSA